MDGCDGANARLQFGYDALVDFPSLGMSSHSMPIRVSGMAPFNPMFGYGWDPLNQMEYLQSSSLMSYSQYGNGNPQHQQHPFLENEGNYSLAQDQSVSTFFEDRPIFPAMVGPFGVSEVKTYCSNWEGDSYGETLIHAVVSQECKISEEEAVKSSPKERRRKRGADEWQGDPSKNDNDVPNRKDQKIQKVEGDPGVKSSSKQEGERKTSGTSKPNYVHVRARQGQATNSHSLAERVRREKISERMRVLQELVPGCSKITGKAVMLDEIINYVQSLQRQVEFLAMKLAMVVGPGITVDLERAVSKHVEQPHLEEALILMFNQKVLMNDQKTDTPPQVFPKVEQQKSFQI